MMTPIRYSLGYSMADVQPRQCAQPTPEDAVNSWLDKPSKVKGQKYISCGFENAPDTPEFRAKKNAVGNPYRCAALAKPRAFVGLDIDEGLTPDSFTTLVSWAQNYSSLIYTTARSTVEKPRCRAILFLDREVDRNELIHVSLAVQSNIRRDVSAEIVFDRNCNRIEQPLFLPLETAQVFV